MYLFPPEKINLLPFDGTAYYTPDFYSEQESRTFFISLFEGIAWENDELIIFGKRIITARKTAWYADEGLTYTYSKVTRNPLPWIEPLIQIKNKIENYSGDNFNACLLNLYHNGNEGVSWHSDDERELGANPKIASLSLGASRKFVFKHKKKKDKIEIFLENGSLLLMEDQTQSHWVHSLPKTKRVHHPRINLTFRKILNS